MKKLALVVLAVFVTSIAFSQKTNVTSAFNALQNGWLDKAKKYIDLATINIDTKGEAKTWFYRGNIYFMIAAQKADSKYKILDTNAIQIAYESYQKAIELDPETQQTSFNPPIPMTPMIGLVSCAVEFFNKGVEDYQKKDYTAALGKFETSKKLYSLGGQPDTLSTNGAMLCALQLKDNKKAKTYMEELVKMNFKQTEVHSKLATIYMSEGDTTKAFNLIKNARKTMPTDLNLIISEINIYLAKGQNIEAQSLLDLAVSKDPTNPALYFVIGVNMDENGKFNEAEKAYLKAIELKPDFGDAYYNLGVLYINTALDIKKQKDTLAISETVKYDELSKTYNELLEKAIPILNKADNLKPDDITTLFSLKQLYALKGDMTKAKEYDDRTNALNK